MEEQLTRKEDSYDITAIEGLIKCYVAIPDNLENFINSLDRRGITSVKELEDFARGVGKPKLVALAFQCKPYAQRNWGAFKTALGHCRGHVKSMKDLNKRMSPEDQKTNTARVIKETGVLI